MLQTLRDKTKGWIAAAILIVLAVPFAFFGVENYFSPSVATYVAKVNDAEIGQDAFLRQMDQYRAQMRQRMGEAYDPTQFESPETKRQVLDQMINEELLKQASARLGLVVSGPQVQREIAAIPAFQVDGRFDSAQYVQTLAATGRTPRSFEEEVIRDLNTRALPTQVAQSGFVTDAYLDRYLALRDQTRSFKYVTLPRPGDDAVGEIADADIQAHYDANADRYQSEETVSIEYLEIEAAKLDVAETVDEATLQQRYEEQKARFVEPEQRLASHILVQVDANADADAQKAAEAKAADIAAKARAEGADFAALAKESSDDIGSKAGGGDLGWLERGITDPAFDAALFAMQPGTISDPVKSADGWHVIQLREVREETGKSFADVKAELEREYLDGERERHFSDLTGKLVDIIYRDPTTLGTASTELGFPVQTTAAFTRAGGPGITARPEVLQAAFSDGVLVDGNVSDIVDLGPGHAVVLRVAEHTPATTKPLDAVRDEVIAAIRAERIDAAAQKDLDASLAAVTSLDALQALAADRSIEVQTADAVGRTGAAVDPAIARAAFALPHPAADGASIGSATLASGDHAIIVLTAVQDGDPSKTEAAMRQMMKDQLAQAVGGVESIELLNALRKEAKIEVVETRL
ncbi:SurA N-terminal domain-containing protein [Chiayiivirga flava]|uniref:Periplasmic chaperone PpiD n=1 Tax=Chiayiivirga flava TaxID=659595 RepID=A0A7W8D933_9GAMM|nr:SurA N-terminal domain-containing protein [Chiayiivirga flava]MBB5209042.1 peptidyl-prolyl cis-trans isomerase D [Chiayiivirga flava]